MKKYIIGIVAIIIVLIAAVYLIAEKQYDHGSSSHIYYICDSEAAPAGGTSFTIEKKSDGQYHLVIASKPPQTDIIVTRTELELFNYEYSGNGVDVKDSTTTLQVKFNGKVLQNCHKLYPGI